MLRGAPRTERVFPSNAFLWDDGDRRVLVDTGYAPASEHRGVAGSLYRRILPPRLPDGGIAERVDPESVTHVVLTHLHPDHIGGVARFPHARFLLSAGIAGALARPRLRDGLLRRLLPEWFPGADSRVIEEFRHGPHGFRIADPFGDGSVLVVDLPGHARGHVGVLFERRALVAGDAAWGRDLLGAEHRMRRLPRAVAHDPDAQLRTARMLLDAEADGIRLLFSHDRHPAGDLR